MWGGRVGGTWEGGGRHAERACYYASMFGFFFWIRRGWALAHWTLSFCSARITIRLANISCHSRTALGPSSCSSHLAWLRVATTCPGGAGVVRVCRWYWVHPLGRMSVATEKPIFVAGSRRFEANAVSTAPAADDATESSADVDVAAPPATDETPLDVQPSTLPNAEEAMSSVLGDLQEIGAIDAEAQQELMEILKDAKPDHYPLIVQQFRAALEFRQQLQQREEATRFANITADEQVLATSAESAVAIAIPPTHTRKSFPTATQLDKNPVQMAPTSLPAAPLTNRTYVARSPRQIDMRGVMPNSAEPRAAHRPISGSSIAIRNDTQDATEVGTRAAAHSPSPAPTTHWQAALHEATEVLATEVAPSPRSTAELHDQMRLRALQLLAGQEDEAFQPISGAAPGLQDYWAKQLYALSTYLDDQSGQDEKQRASATLVHLEAARQTALGTSGAPTSQSNLRQEHRWIRHLRSGRADAFPPSAAGYRLR